MQAIQKDTEDVKLRAIEFWSTVAETEGDIVVELQDAQESGRAPGACERVCVRGIAFCETEWLLVSPSLKGLVPFIAVPSM